MPSRIEALEHDSNEGNDDLPTTIPLPDIEEEELPPFSDREGCVFHSTEHFQADDEPIAQEPKGFDPIKSRYKEGLK